jgi:hypothetical protein
VLERREGLPDLPHLSMLGQNKLASFPDQSHDYDDALKKKLTTYWQKMKKRK